MDQKNINKKVLWGVFSVFFLLMSVGVGLVLNNQVQKTNVGASGVNLTLTTNNTNPKVNDVISVAVAMNTQGMAVTGLDLKVKYDPNKLMPTAITSGGFLPNIFIPGVISSNTAGIVLGCPIDNSGPHPVSGSGLAAQITFIVKNAGASTISIEPDTKISVSGQTVNMIGNLTPIQITATAANTCTGTGSCTTLFCPTMAPCPSGMACPQVMPSCITTNGNCINGVCISSTPNPSVCGGIQGILCPSGKECIYSNGTTNAPYPDATGNCQASTPKASPTPSPTPSRSPSPTPSKSPSPTRTPSPIPTRSPSPTPSRSPSPTPTKSPSPSPSPFGTGYTMAQIATHNTVSNCWLLLSGKVYNVTNYISSHPGGTSVITSNCGKDATQAFAAIGHSNTAKNILAQYLIGYLLGSKTPTPSPTNNRIAGDVDSNGIINIVDVGILIDNFGDNPLLDTRPDLNNDGRVNIIDLGIIIDNYPQ